MTAVYVPGGACTICGHRMDPHVVAGTHTAPEFTHGHDVPICGYMTCPEPDCLCWSTWSIAHPDLPPGLLAVIDQAVAEIRRVWLQPEA